MCMKVFFKWINFFKKNQQTATEPENKEDKHKCIVHASGDFSRLLITFANSLDPDQDNHNFSPDLDPNR